MMETFVTNLVGEKIFGLSYKGASVTYGRRFLIESADEIWAKLQSARKDGAPTTALYDLYNDYLQSRYSSNAMEMQRLLKLAKIEPLPFVKYDEFAKMQTFPDVIVRKKYWFERWVNTKPDASILFDSLDILQADFKTFCDDQEKAISADTIPAPAPPAPVPLLPLNNN